jgi:MurNAc alpha-1-phosphate uridylyltransferase
MTMRIPKTAMVLAAGRGLRMRPITDTIPKPLVRIAGKPLIDWALDALARAGVERAVVNVHHLADQIEAHVSARKRPRVEISDERAELLESGGGVVKALPRLGDEPFFVVNADTFWIDRGTPGLQRLALAWQPARMDILLMLTDTESATGHGRGADFTMGEDMRLARAAKGQGGLIYAGAGIVHPRIFASAEAVPHSLNLYFDRAIATGRLAGVRMEGVWITVGTPDAIAPAEAAVARAMTAL